MLHLLSHNPFEEKDERKKKKKDGVTEISLLKKNIRLELRYKSFLCDHNLRHVIKVFLSSYNVMDVTSIAFHRTLFYEY